MLTIRVVQEPTFKLSPLGFKLSNYNRFRYQPLAKKSTLFQNTLLQVRIPAALVVNLFLAESAINFLDEFESAKEPRIVSSQF